MWATVHVKTSPKFRVRSLGFKGCVEVDYVNLCISCMYTYIYICINVDTRCMYVYIYICNIIYTYIMI